MRVAPVAHLQVEEQLAIEKVAALEGFYYANYTTGFRDRPDLTKIHQTIGERLLYLEARSGEAASVDAIGRIIRSALCSSIHIMPNYSLYAKTRQNDDSNSYFEKVVAATRDTLLSFYAKIDLIFPQQVNYHIDECVCHPSNSIHL